MERSEGAGGGGGSDDEGHSSGNGEDDSFGTKSSPLIFSKFMSRSKGSLLVRILKCNSNKFPVQINILFLYKN